MVEVTHLPSNCSSDDIIHILERDGVAIVAGFVDQSWLNDFNRAIHPFIDNYEPYGYGEPDALDFLGHQTVRPNGLISKVPGYIDLISDQRLLCIMDHFLHTTVEQAHGWPVRVRQLLGYDLYAHYDENIEAGPLGYYKNGSPDVLFKSDAVGEAD